MAPGRLVKISPAPTRKDFASYPLFFLLVISSLLMSSIQAGAAAAWDEREEAAISFCELERMSTGRRLLATQSLLEDAEALLLIKASIVDPNNFTFWWKRQGNSQALNPCKMRNGTKNFWPGIDCTDKRVTSINLSNHSLGGTLSPALGTLSRLTHLDLSNNLLSGAIPMELASATALETLDLGNNYLEGTLPSQLGDLRNLTSLVVANNRLGGSIPSSLGTLQLLVTLNMSTNNLTGAIPQELNACKRLTQVDLSKNGPLQGIVPFQSLDNLTLLHLQNNQFEGDFLTRLDTFPRLQNLDLTNNSFSGVIPTTISTLSSINQLFLGHNSLTGTIPVSLGDLLQLQRVDLSGNQFTGSLPDAVGSLIELRELDVSSNGLRNGLPKTLASLSSLLLFNASLNAFNGQLPALAGLKSLQVFDVSFNNLTGSIQNDFVDFSSLLHLNVSNNDLSGEVPSFTEHDDVNSRSFLNNSGLCGRFVNKKCKGRDSRSMAKSTIVSIAVGSSVAFVVVVVVICKCCAWFTRRRGKSKSSASVSAELELKLTPEDILRATQNFSDRNYIGVGSMSTVYRGILPDATVVAVKRLGIRRGEMSEGAEKVLADSFETLGHVRNWTLVKVVGYCCSPDIKALVMEYMPNGTLSSLMYPQLDAELVREFNWNDRFNAALAVAQGLKFLHHECQTSTVHGGLKPSNIMFNTFKEARVTDFSVARILSGHGLGIGASLANGYTAPEAATSGCTIKGDVYSFGIIVLEMISGRSPQSLEAGQKLPQWIRGTISNTKSLHNVLDPILMGSYASNNREWRWFLEWHSFALARILKSAPTLLKFSRC